MGELVAFNATGRREPGRMLPRGMEGQGSDRGRRVVITGAGIVSSIGSGREAFWDSLDRGSSGAGRIELEGVREITACVVGDLDDSSIPKREAKRMDRAAVLAVVAARCSSKDARR